MRPRLDLSASAGYERSNRLDSAGSIVNQDGQSRRATLVLRQPLYDGAEISSEAERANRLANVLVYELRQAEDTLLLEMARAWVDLVRQQQLITVATANIEAHERLVALVRSRVNSGVGRGVDLDQALGRLASTRLLLSSDMGTLSEAASRFRRWALVAPPAGLRQLLLDPTFLPGAEYETISRALNYSPVLGAASENHAAIDAEVRVRRSAFAPRIAIEGRHDLAARTSSLRDASGSSVLLTFNYNLYAGGGDVARQEDAVLRLGAARQQFQDAAVTLRQSVAASWAELERQQSINRNASSYVESVAKARDVYRVQYDIGQRSLLDLLNTENELAQAQRQEINSRTDALQAQLRLLSLTGRLHDALVVARSEVAWTLPPRSPPSDVREFIGLSASELLPQTAVTTPPVLSRDPVPMAASASVLTTPSAPPPAPAPAAVPSSARQVVPAAPTAIQSAALPTLPDRAAAPAMAASARGRESDESRRRVAAVPHEFVPGSELRLPAALGTALKRWLQALESGVEARMGALYQAPEAKSENWSVTGLRTVNSPAARRVGLVLVDQIDDNRQFEEPSVQIAIIATLNDPGGVRCVRSSQIWRRDVPGERDSSWRIIRERALLMPDSACRPVR